MPPSKPTFRQPPPLALTLFLVLFIFITIIFFSFLLFIFFFFAEENKYSGLGIREKIFLAELMLKINKLFRKICQPQPPPPQIGHPLMGVINCATYFTVGVRYHDYVIL